MATDAELRESIEQALFEGTNPRGFSKELQAVYAQMLIDAQAPPPKKEGK